MTVLAGGESYSGERPLHYDWVKRIYDRCIKYRVEFIFGQTGNYFVKKGKTYFIKDHKTQIDQALASGLQNRDKENITMTKDGICEFIARQKTSVISSVGEDGYPATRALIQPLVCTFTKKGISFSGVEIKGDMTVLTDQPTKQRFWKPFFTRFYKKGVTDPDYCILKFTGFEAQWFTNRKTETIQL